MKNRHDEQYEEQRLKELQRYDILDSLTEKDYDDITYMASIICDVPVALITLVDSERQWFKSHHGTEIDETPREISFCTHTIRENAPLIVDDLRKDVRFMNNPLVTGDLNVVFYAGIPLISENGYGLGTVCVLDVQPRVLNENQLNALRILTGQAMNLLELRRVNHELNLSNQTLEAENQELGNLGRRLQNQLERHISERIREVAEQNANLEKMNRELQAFAYISSHDLQEPLRKMQTFSSYLIETESENMTEKGQEYLSKILKASGRMRSLISDLLAYSRTTTLIRKFEISNLESIIENVKLDLEEEIEEKNAEIRILEDCDINVIPYQFRQVIYNLLANSIKFARKDIPLIIKMSSKTDYGNKFEKSETEPGKLYSRIIISDNGIGFDNQYRDKIFELFQRLHTQELHIGTGIGLAIVKKIVENHNGFIYAESSENVGTTFEILIPA